MSHLIRNIGWLGVCPVITWLAGKPPSYSSLMFPAINLHFVQDFLTRRVWSPQGINKVIIFPAYIYIYTHYIIISPFVLVKSSMFEGRKTLPDVQHPIEGPEGHRATMSCCSRLFAVFLKEHSATSERWKVPQGKHQEIPLWGHHVKHSNCLNPYKWCFRQ